jgi:hypothetical protein
MPPFSAECRRSLRNLAVLRGSRHSVKNANEQPQKAQSQARNSVVDAYIKVAVVCSESGAGIRTRLPYRCFRARASGSCRPGAR